MLRLTAAIGATLLAFSRSGAMADIVVAIVRVLAEIRDISNGVNGNDQQASRLLERVVAIEPAVLAVKRGIRLPSSEALPQLLATVEEARNFLRGYARTSLFKRVLNRKTNAGTFTELGVMLTEGVQALQLDVAVDAWAKEDESDRLDDCENMMDAMERMERNRMGDHETILGALKVSVGFAKFL